ncbi:MAG TPA: ABC transporter substrate-binding protein [Patescibacteria group bacterium]
MQPYTRRPAAVASSFSLAERILAGVAVILLGVGVFGMVKNRNQATELRPVHGGTYTEGVIADSPTKVDRIVMRLTNSGLTYRAADGSIKPALAESWEVSQDGKQYRFRLREGFSAESFLATIQASKTNWTGITTSAPEPNVIQFVLPESLQLFLASTTVPLFPYGPYKVAKRDKSEVVLRANNDFVLGKPYLEKFVIKQYETTDQLASAAKSGQIDGTADLTDVENRSFVRKDVSLPRYYVLFFNMTKPLFKKVEDRQRIIDLKDGNPVTYNLVTTQSGDASDLADILAQNAKLKNITLNVQKKSGAALQKEDLPKREFDLLLYGINYGVDRDYYPFWHSSQATATGLNLSGVKDRDLDRLLESARHEVDGAKRAQLNQQIEDLLSRNALQKVLQQETFHFWIAKSIYGVEYGTMIDEGSDRFNLVWQWHKKVKKVPINS